MKRLLLTLLLACLTCVTALAQETTPPPEPESEVYVTTQDFSSFRTGPGTAFRRLTVIPPVITLPAIGRTSDTRWVQVVYKGQRGWIASILLVWSGDIIKLPVDGIESARFIRRAAALGVTIRETPIYRNQVTPEDQVGTIPERTQVELTGRLGGSTGNYFRFQIRHQGQLYWVGSWNIRVIDGNYLRLLDLAYLFPYGRLVRQLERNLAENVGSFTQIQSVWRRLSNGDQVRCAPIPPQVRQFITESDASKEPSFAPAVRALDSAIKSTNTAIAAFADVCGNKDPNFVLTREAIDAALKEVDNAERNLIIAGSLLEPLRRRNPLLDTGAE
jgi:hypothetical protein